MVITHGPEGAAQLIQCSLRSILDKRYRMRHGIVARKVGRRLVFLEADLLRVLERGRETMPGGEGRR